MGPDFFRTINVIRSLDEQSKLKKRQSAISLSEMPYLDENKEYSVTSTSTSTAAAASSCNKVSFFLNDSILKDDATTNKDNFDLQTPASALGMTTTSPDSKRFKCEAALPTSQLDINDPGSATLGLYNRQSDFNRSKKVFEFLADKQRKQQEEDQQSTGGQAPSDTSMNEVLAESGDSLTTRNRSSFKSSPLPVTAPPTTTATGETMTSTATVTLRRRSELGKCHPLSVLINKTN